MKSNVTLVLTKVQGKYFLGSVYTDEASWKIMRIESETMKREE